MEGSLERSLMSHIVPVEALVSSWSNTEGNVNTIESILEWIDELNSTTFAKVTETEVTNDSFWFYDDYAGEILNRKRAFFSIKGIRMFDGAKFIKEQPIIIQPEIGYLGIICKMIEHNGVNELNLLMQAKIEPGNVNCVQISPTIQATKSNFLRAHGGKLPAYFDMFASAGNGHSVIYDQVQSEQAARFFRKRNRNMIILVTDDIEVLPGFKWMTLGQLKELMKHDNLVNMDTRTVISGIPFITSDLSSESLSNIQKQFTDQATFKSIFQSISQEYLPNIYQSINDYKMFHDIRGVIVPLNQLVDWQVDSHGITSLKASDFDVRYYDIEISGREVRHWTQPLFRALGQATFVLLSRIQNGIRQFLVKATPEIGAFDNVEIGPTVQWEPTHQHGSDDAIERLVYEKLRAGATTICDVVLSEEGGRFYHEQNRNVILQVEAAAVPPLPEGYQWVDLHTLNWLTQINNQLNIQLRNLISLLPL